MSVAGAVAVGVVLPAAANSKWGQLHLMHDYAACFGVPDPEADTPAGLATVTLLSSNAPGNVFVPGETPRFAVQVERPDRQAEWPAKAELHLIRYAMRAVPGDNWFPRLVPLERYPAVEIELNGPADADWFNIELDVDLPETFGGYGVVLDLGPMGRHLVTSLVRAFAHDVERLQYPKQSLEKMPPAILERLGVQAIRKPIQFRPPGTLEAEPYAESLHRELRELHEHKVTAAIEFGVGPDMTLQPMGRTRPHLTEDGETKRGKRGKRDHVWLPEHDDTYEQYVYDIVAEFGWPKGPVTGVMLWNEPWEGSSISGWQADLPRYRELWRRTVAAVHRARDEAGVEVLVGGADSSSNTFDKLFSEGLEASPFWPDHLDFCSMHYQALSVPALDASWRSDEHPLGRVLLWDTESWVANADDRFAGVVAACRAAGYDRVMGSLSRIAISTLSHGRIATDTIQTADGAKEVPRIINARPLAAAYSAAQAFLGEREFDRVMFHDAVPWVFVFRGLGDQPDDGTVVVLGDLDALFHQRTPDLLRKTGVQPLDPEVIPTLVIDNPDGAFAAHDAYGNVKPADAANPGRIVVPLDQNAVYLRATPGHTGGFAALLEALEDAELVGLEPLDLVVRDTTTPIDAGAAFGLTLANQHGRAVDVELEIAVDGLTLDYPRTLRLEPRASRDLDVRVVAGRSAPSNLYPMRVRAAVRTASESGTPRDLGVAAHDETVRVNRIARQTVTIDGDLVEWAGRWPQAIDAADEGLSLEEAMWTPFVPFEAGSKPGRATAFLAYDDEAFYFAARIADPTPEPGTIRFGDRDESADFYPQVAYEALVTKPEDPPFSARWTGQLVAEQTGTHEIAFRGDDGFRVWVDGEQVIDLWQRQHPTWASARVELRAGEPTPIRVEWFSEFGNAYAELAWKQPGDTRRRTIPADSLRPDDTGRGRGLTGEYFLGTEHDHHVMTRIDQGMKFRWQAGVPEGFTFDLNNLPRRELRWPEDVRRYSYRRRPLTPGSASQRPFDNVQIGFNVLEPGEDGWLVALPGRPPHFPSYRTTDHAFALNRVADAFGGGTEVFRLDAPHVPRQHGFPRQPRHAALGPVADAQLVIRHDAGTRTVEAAIPWGAVPEVRAAMLAGRPVKFSYRVNHGEGNFNMELPRGRSAALGLSRSFHPDWNQSWPNELSFGWDRPEPNETAARP